MSDWPLERGRGSRSQLNPFVLEVVALADQRAKHLLASGADDARGQRQRDLLGVAEAIAADEAVLVEELRIVEVGERRIEQRNPILVAERRVNEVRARLQRLRNALAEPLRATLEREAAVHAGPWHGDVLAVAQHGARQVIVGIAHSELGHEEVARPPGTAPRAPG
jgi:hypothetical protein